MPVVAVVNRKGGSGKSTLATHLAAYCANAGLRVMLGDVDRQQSTQAWLRLRETQELACPPIVGWAVDPNKVMRAPAGVTHVVLDTPGGMRGFDLARVVMVADVVLMPVCNSVFDRESAAECFAELKTLPRVAGGRCRVAAIGMRLDARTRAGEVLKNWADAQQLPFLGVLRETQAYVRTVERGLTLFDLPSAQAQPDLAQWAPILQWLRPVLFPAPVAVENRAPSRGPTVLVRQQQAGAPAAGAQARPASHPATAPRAPVLSRPAARASVANRLTRMLDALPIPRFLQRNP
jgi:chromosome partitioning protein